MNLSARERVKRWWGLHIGQSYTHPDGHIELDFEGPAGINSRTDSDEVQQAKLARYEQRKAEQDHNASRMLGAGFLGLAAYWFAAEPVPLSHPIGTAATVALGFWMLRR